MRFDKDGLIPVVVQDYYSKEVLMVAYMNEESLAMTVKDQLMTYYSRSRNALWRKGETSGNFQHLISLTTDCDQDTLLAKVIKDGPACHKGTESCFAEQLFCSKEKPSFSIEELYRLIADRKKNPSDDSYTSYLFEKGLEKILKKIGEESTEVVIGAMKEDKGETIYETADLIYHLLVLLVEMDISVAEVKAELSQRQIIDHKLKQETSSNVSGK